MKSPQNPRGEGGQPESPASKETFPHRQERPGEVGLANEVRPGLGTRADTDGAAPLKKPDAKKVAQDREPLGRDAPLPPRDPQEQKDAAAREQERDTGVSGHTSAD